MTDDGLHYKVDSRHKSEIRALAWAAACTFSTSLSIPVLSSTVRHALDHRMRCFHDSLIWLCSVGWKRMPPFEANAASKLLLVEAAAFVARLSALLSSSTLSSRALTRASGNMPASGGFSNLHAQHKVLTPKAGPLTEYSTSMHPATPSSSHFENEDWVLGVVLCDSAYPFCCSSNPKSLANCRLGLFELPLLLAPPNRPVEQLTVLSACGLSVWPATAR